MADNSSKAVVEWRMRMLITTVLGGPGGDPDYHHMKAAAIAVHTLEDLGIPFGGNEKDDEMLDFLKGDNIFHEDFYGKVQRNEP